MVSGVKKPSYQDLRSILGPYSRILLGIRVDGKLFYEEKFKPASGFVFIRRFQNFLLTFVLKLLRACISLLFVVAPLKLALISEYFGNMHWFVWRIYRRTTLLEIISIIYRCNSLVTLGIS